jgi:iron complex outermembrane recepter protein
MNTGDGCKNNSAANAGALYLALVMTTLASQTGAIAADVGGPSEWERLDEIIVTAQKKEEDLQNVPVAVTALTSEALERLHVESFNDLDGLAPNLYVTTSVAGSDPLITLRGVLSTNPTNGTDAPVAMYIDGIYIARTTGSSFDIADIDRVEVLRGPQGTLYGRNSPGGAINFITSPPSGEFSGHQDVTAGNLGQVRTKSRLDLPEFDGVSLSFTYVHDQNDGWVRNTEAGTTWDFTAATGGLVSGMRVSPEYLGANNSDSGLFALRFRPADAPVTIDYRFDMSQKTSTNLPNQALVDTTGLATASSTAPLSAIPQGFTTPETLKAFGNSLVIAWKINDELQLKSLTGVRQDKDYYSTDVEGTGATVDVGAGVTLPFEALSIVAYEQEKTLSQEFQLNFDSKQISAVAGLYYFRETTFDLAPVYIFQALPSHALPSQSVFPANEYGDDIAYNKSYAGYGQGTVHVTDRLDFTAGARFTEDVRRTDEHGFIINFATGEKTDLDSYARNFDHLDWTSNLTYHLADNAIVYAKAGTGYLSGGVFHGTSFEPEKLLQYEIGEKIDLLGRRLRIDTALFHSDYSDLQVAENNSEGVYIVENAGKAKIDGMEAEITALPIDHLTLSASWGYTNFRFIEKPPGYNVERYVPRQTVRLGGEYKLPIAAPGITTQFNIDALWHSKTSLIDQFLSSPPFPVYAEGVITNNAYWDVRPRLTILDDRDDRFKPKISFWVKNLLDKRVVVNADDDALGIINGVFSEPRTYGVDMSVRF